MIINQKEKTKNVDKYLQILYNISYGFFVYLEGLMFSLFILKGDFIMGKKYQLCIITIVLLVIFILLSPACSSVPNIKIYDDSVSAFDQALILIPGAMTITAINGFPFSAGETLYIPMGRHTLSYTTLRVSNAGSGSFTQFFLPQHTYEIVGELVRSERTGSGTVNTYRWVIRDITSSVSWKPPY